jgi:hypothetical protein
LLAVTAGLSLLAACTNQAPEQEAEETEIPEELARAAPAVVAAGGIGTPMAERVAVLGLLNKRNNISRDIELKPGEQRRIGDVVVRLSACERTAPWEEPPETGAFVQVVVQQRADADSDLEWQRVFSGWLFKNSPSLNVVEHPIYDVWVKDCKMSFPGEEAPLADDDDGDAARVAAPAPAASPSPTEAPAVAPAPAARTNDE